MVLSREELQSMSHEEVCEALGFTMRRWGVATPPLGTWRATGAHEAVAAFLRMAAGLPPPLEGCPLGGPCECGSRDASETRSLP